MYLGLDIGTTATKAILIDRGQAVMARAQTAYPTEHPAPGLSEQDPARWLEAIRAVLAQLREAAPSALAAVEGIGLSGQMHSLVVLGADQAPLCPAILWNDTRGAAECGKLMADIPDLGTLTGVIAMPSFTAPKLLWLRGHRPDLFARIAHILWPKDYVRLWLTGEWATDMSDAAGGQMLDGAARRWAEPVLGALGLSHRQLPPLLEGTAVAGRLRPEAAEALGLPAGIPVAAGGGDAGTGALGLSCVSGGSSFISLGTGTNFVVAQEVFAPRPEATLHDFAHCVPGRWYQMAAMLNGASCLAWVAGLTGESDIGALLAKVERRYAGPSRVVFLPYLNGERTPHNDTAIRGSFIGLDSATDAVDIAQAVLEGVAFSLKDARNALLAAGCDFETPAFIGGGSRSMLWGRIIASVLGAPLGRREGADLGPALGAARLGLIAATGTSVASAIDVPIHETLIEPDLALQAPYEEAYATYAALYPALARLRARLSA